MIAVLIVVAWALCIATVLALAIFEPEEDDE